MVIRSVNILKRNTNGICKIHDRSGKKEKKNSFDDVNNWPNSDVFCVRFGYFQTTHRDSGTLTLLSPTVVGAVAILPSLLSSSMEKKFNGKLENICK